MNNTGQSNRSTAGLAAPQPQSPISAAINDLHSALTALESVVDSLYVRTELVVYAPPKPEGRGDLKEAVSGSTLHCQVDSASARVNACINRISMRLNELEI